MAEAPSPRGGGLPTSRPRSRGASLRRDEPRREDDLPIGEKLILSAAFDKDGEEAPGVATGTLSLYHGGEKVGEGRIKTQPGTFSVAGEGLCVGRDGGEAVTTHYPGSVPWPFAGGTIRRVAVD